MSKGNCITAITAFLIAWFIMPLLIPFALSAALLGALLIIAVVILRTLDTPQAHALAVIIGFVLGILVSLVIPGLRISSDVLVTIGMGMLLALQV